MKHLKFFFLAALFAAITVTAQNTSTTDEGVVINGVKWATRNVDTPGTFAETPESYGRFYQWNRNWVWESTVHTYKSYPSYNSTQWNTAEDPCPAGWRVPTLTDFQTLVASDMVTSTWVNNIVTNPSGGFIFTDNATGNTLFLPAAGIRNSSGLLVDVGKYGSYWTSTPVSSTGAYAMKGGCFNTVRESGFSIRCVADSSASGLSDAEMTEEKNAVAFYNTNGCKTFARTRKRVVHYIV